MKDRCTKQILNNMRDTDTWERIRADYERANEMPYKPGPEFSNPKEGTVIDEDKTVRWNREEVTRQQKIYKDETARLRKARNEAIVSVTDRAIKMIAEETWPSEDKARVLWDFVYEKHHAYFDMFNQIDEYIMLINDLKEDE